MMKSGMGIVLVLGLAFGGFFSHVAYGEESAPSATESPRPPSENKSVHTQLEEPKSARAVGVKAADPSQNGRVNTSGALSPMNQNSVGVGVQFDLSKPKKVAPKKKADDSDDSDEDELN